MADKTTKLAAIQMATGPNVSANLLETERLVSEAADSGAGLVVLPENFAFMGKRDQDQLSLREADGEGPLQDFLSQMARKYAIWLVGGTIPMFAQDASKVRAACMLFDDTGKRVARYDKMHLFDVHLMEADERYIESSTIEPGDEIVVVDTPFGRLGLAVCYDLRFPELFRAMQERGVDLFAIPSSFTAITGKAHWEVLVRARAVENLAYVIAAAQGGYHINGRETHGNSMVVDPWGAVLATVPRGNGSISCVMDREYQATVRRTFPTLAHRRLSCS